MKLLSLFDGSGGFPLAGAMCGILPIAASEVEPYPIAVTKSRFPKMKHLGDVTKINGAEIEPADIVCFGFPCQDVSVAGKRKSVKHKDKGDDETTRSGLVWEAIRIIKEMRGATNGKYPRFAVFENVPGLFSAEKGETFRTVVEGLIQIVEPSAVMPEVPTKRWAYADSYVGTGWSFAYRIFDAQYIRTAQRRRRVYACLDLGGQCARQILFERESLRGYPPQSGTQREGTPSDAEGSIGTDDREGACYGFPLGFRPENVRCYEETATTLCNGTRAGFCNGVITLEPAVVYAVDQGGGKSQANVTEDLSPTLTCTHGGEPVIALDRASFNQGKNALYDPQLYKDGTNPTLVAKGPSAVCTRYIVRRLTPTECARLQGFPDRWGDIDHKDDFTDEEYEFWLNVRNTHAEINGKQVKDYTKKQMLTWYNKLHTDSAEYKLWGNGIALPCALYVMQGIADVMKGEKSETD